MRVNPPLPFVERLMGDSHATTNSRHGTLDHAARSASFAMLYERHVVEVYQYVHRRCRDRTMAEDVTHDVFLAAVRTLDDPDSITVGWLIRVARNRMVDVLRRQHRYKEKLRVIRGGQVDEVDLSSQWVDRVRLEAAMEKLSIEHRLVLTLHYLDGIPVPALAKELGRTVKAIEGVVARAKRNLQRELGARDG